MNKPREYLKKKTHTHTHTHKNWRPISLLNVVYNIATLCVAEKMKWVVPKLVSEDQSGFMANTYIGNNTRH